MDLAELSVESPPPARVDLDPISDLMSTCLLDVYWAPCEWTSNALLELDALSTSFEYIPNWLSFD